MHVRLNIPKVLEEECRIRLEIGLLGGRFLLVLFCGYSSGNSILLEVTPFLAWALLCPDTPGQPSKSSESSQPEDKLDMIMRPHPAAKSSR